MASKILKVYELNLYHEYGEVVQYRSVEEGVGIYIPYKEFSDPKNLPKRVTVTVEENG